MHGFLKESVHFNGLTFEPGTKVLFEHKQSLDYKRISPQDCIVVKAAMDGFPAKIIVRKSQIRVNTDH